MFEKKQIIFSERLGVCRVEDIVRLTPSKNADTYLYYLLKSVTDKSKSAYIPVEGHEVLLRELISVEEAGALIETADENTAKNLLDEANYVMSQKKE